MGILVVGPHPLYGRGGIWGFSPFGMNGVLSVFFIRLVLKS